MNSVMLWWLFVLFYSCIDLRVSFSLHLKGTWNSNKEFFKFLTKFGFQKTDPKDLENTQGFIYGNITLSHESAKINHASLVVVDSEYFLEFYGNRTLPPSLACPAMLSKIDTIAFDSVCKPKGLEDFLRKIPCPKDKVCVDEDNPDNVVPSYQFTYKVRDVQRPRFWYLNFVSCFRNTSKKECNWLSSNNPGLVVDYDIWLVNGNPSVKGLNPFEHQFSFEFHDVFEIHLVGFALYLIIFMLWLYVFNQQRHIITKIFAVCICGEVLSVMLNLIHVSIFAANGVGAGWLGKLGTMLDLATQCLFMLLLLLLAKGLGITTDQFKWKSLVFSVWSAYTVLNVFLYIWNLVEIDNIISNTDEWQSWPGYATLAFRIVVMFWFLYHLRQTYGNRSIDDHPFVVHFGAFYLLWFCYLPTLALITTQVSPLWRYKTIISITYAVDVLAYTVLIYWLWPARSILFLVEGERPLPTYDLEITGLLDDMQETTLFSRRDLDLSNGGSNINENDETQDDSITDWRQNGNSSNSNGKISLRHSGQSRNVTRAVVNRVSRTDIRAGQGQVTRLNQNQMHDNNMFEMEDI